MWFRVCVSQNKKRAVSGPLCSFNDGLLAFGFQKTLQPICVNRFGVDCGHEDRQQAGNFMLPRSVMVNHPVAFADHVGEGLNSNAMPGHQGP
jgi:hypothetical protein